MRAIMQFDHYIYSYSYTVSKHVSVRALIAKTAWIAFKVIINHIYVASHFHSLE